MKIDVVRQRLKTEINRKIAKVKLEHTKVTANLLLMAGFEPIGEDFSLGTLTIYNADGVFYYDKNGKLFKIKNAQKLSNLVYNGR